MITIDHLVRKNTDCILPTHPQLRSANFGQHFTRHHYQLSITFLQSFLCI